MRTLSDRLAALSPEKLDLLRRRLMTTSEGASSPRIPRCARTSDVARPSFAQERLWFDQQLEPESPAYNLGGTVRLQGPLDVALLESCFHETLNRNETLRTNFRLVDGEVIVVVSPPRKAIQSTRDLSHLPADEQEAEIRRFSEAEACRPFQLDSEPLFRHTIIRLGDEQHVIVFAVHHLVFDGGSGGVQFRQLFALYGEGLQGRPLSLPDLQIQYSDYAVWQRDQLGSAEYLRQAEYWKHQLEGMPALLDLPCDRPHPVTRAYRGATHTFEIPLSLLAGLKGLGREQDATLYMTLLAAFKALLYRYTLAQDLVVGMPITMRTLPELEEMVGLFVNTLVLRTAVEGNLPFRRLLDRVREVTLGAYANRDYPFEKLVEELKPVRYAGRTPLIQVLFDLQRTPVMPEVPQGLRIELNRVDAPTSLFDLSLSLEETERGLVADMAYASDLFDRTTIERMAGHYLTILEGIVENPDRQIRRLPLLTTDERRQLTVEFNDTRTTYPRDRCVHELFEEQARRAPHAVALVRGAEVISYGELSRRSNKLANHLRRLGVGPETLVSVCMDRSIDWMIALLGILKAGGAHVSLDPTYPVERLAFMLADAQAPVLLTTRSLLNKTGETSAKVILVDQDWDQIDLESDEFPGPSATLENAAYVVYTSGSTGRPKGVVNIHRGLLNLAWWQKTTFEVTTEDRASQVARMGFDASVWEVWPYLISGASIAIMDDETRLSPKAVCGWLEEKGVTMGWLPPAIGEGLFQELGIEKLHLRILFGGSDRALQRPPDKARFIYHNPYGPTETSAITTAGILLPRSKDSGPITVGRVLANNEIFILDELLEPVPVGVAGQIYIGGTHLSRGYLNRPELTAAKFIPHPFAQEVSSEEGARLYATGDLGRFLADGRIEVLGRIDDQVKIRGFRVELGEIEQAIADHPSVRETVVIARDERPGDKRLVAYVVPEFNDQATRDRLSHLEDQRVAHWRLLYDQTYGEAGCADIESAFVGWNSSYTGQPIPTDEMVEWRDATVARILALRPRRVFEIGCGTGLLLSEIAPHTESYWASDFSRASLDHIRQRLERDANDFAKVRLLEGTADDFSNIPDGSFDLIILNSVVQYFPDLDYLLRVLEGAIRKVRDGGAIFVGDVRNLKLLAALHASVHLHQAQPATRLADLRQKVLRSASNEEELLIDPMLFAALAQRLPGLSNVDIWFKRGRRQNELNRFRYDVLLHVGIDGSQDSRAEAHPRLDWQKDQLSLDDLDLVLRDELPANLSVSNIPNSRVWSDVRAGELLSDSGLPDVTVSEFRRKLEAIGAVDPEAACGLAEECGYKAEVRWPESGAADTFDLVVRRKDQSFSLTSRWRVNESPLSHFANNPLRPMIVEGILPSLRAALEETLPDYMIPSSFVFLDSLPVVANGKVNRKALPAPSLNGPSGNRNSIPPRTPVEKTIAGIWAETLNLEQVGIEDNLFELGGHSLMVAQIVSRLRDALSVELPLRAVFERPTVAGLAEQIESIRWGIEYLNAPSVAVGEDIEEDEV